jgi:type 1 glutamine amidotransferase
MPSIKWRYVRFTHAIVALVAAAVLGSSSLTLLRAQQAPAAAGQAPGGRGGGGRGGAGQSLATSLDVNKDGSITRDEVQQTFASWFTAWDTSKTGQLTQDDIAAGLGPLVTPAGFGAGPGGARVANDADVQAMMAALPATAPAKPARARKVLVLAYAPGFFHSSIPLAARTIEEMGKKTGAWTTVVAQDPSVVTTENLKQYDAIFLDSNVGAFLDEAGNPAATATHRQAFLDFVRSGKGVAGIHGATDTYHAGSAEVTPPGAPRAGAPAANPPGAGRGGGGVAGPLAAAIVARGDKNNDQKLTRAEFLAVGDAWFTAVDTTNAGKVSTAEFAQRFATVEPSAAPAGFPGGGPGGRGRGAGPGAADAPTVARGSAPSGGTWPEFNKLIGGIFKGHPWQEVPVKVDDTTSPLTKGFKSPTFMFQDETYLFYQDSWSPKNVHRLLSIDYAKMSDEQKAQETAASARTDGQYGLAWIRREGQGRVFYLALGHREDGIFRNSEMLQFMLAGMQYVLGDLKADDSPSEK